MLELIARARDHLHAFAFPGRTYLELLDRSAFLASALLGDADDLHEARVALLVPAGHEYVVAQWAIWRAGGIKVPSCALWSGATIEPFARFDLPAILERVRADAYTLFMAVPTIYVKLIAAIEAASASDRATIVAAFARMRLMVSGSAALPASI